MKFSPIIEKSPRDRETTVRQNVASKCGFESFPRMMTHILCVENCQSYILTHSFLPIAGRLFYNMRKFHGPKISECNLYVTISVCYFVFFIAQDPEPDEMETSGQLANL